MSKGFGAFAGSFNVRRLEFIVSACLAGCRCRYDNTHSEDKYIRELVKNGQALPLCPEMLAGLSVPRPAAEIVGGGGGDVLDGRSRVITQTGDDATDDFIAGAHATAAMATIANVKKAILKSASPSCGVSEIYDGTFSGSKKAGLGVTAALLIREGISIESK